MDPQFLAFLDWPQVLARLSDGAQSDLGRAACLELPLCGTIAEARERSSQVAELVRLWRDEQRWPVLSFTDVEALVDAAEKGIVLGAEELATLAIFCELVAGVRRFFTGEREGAGAVARQAQALGRHDALVELGRQTFDRTGEIRDSASPELGRLRRERDGLAERTRTQVESLIDSAEFAPYLQDRYVTLRSDRFVLPVKASFKSMGLGIVHDTSRTGETVFLEPTALVELNNRLKVTELDIRRECRRILEEVAALVAAEAPALRRDLEILTALDVLTAMARLSVACDGVPAELVAEPVVAARDLRHPLLALRAQAENFRVVANDVSLGDDSGAHILVISGPNAGGKTVLLKSIGLAALFARAGLHVAAAAGVKVGFFGAVLADIGDQQSVLGDLSTFSAHLANLSRILKAVDAPSSYPALVLCDELMAGTNPEQGAGLARAVLEHLAARRCIVVTTTHYDALKALADGDDRFRNAGMEYDLQALRPTYRLKVGQPGRSYALDIATIMGLPPELLDRARSLIGQASLGLETVLRELEEREAALAEQEQAMIRAREELEERSGKEAQATAALVARERDLKLRMREGIEASVRETREALREIVKRARQEVSVRNPDAVVAQARTSVEDLSRTATQGLPETAGALDIEKLRTALAARALGVEGSSSGNRPGNRPGSGKSSGHQAKRAAAHAAAADAAIEVMRTRGNTIDIRGKRADEAISEIETFLDQATLAGSDAAFVIHGHGTGALRRAVREYLALAPHVLRFRPADPGEGGDGVTIAVLRP